MGAADPIGIINARVFVRSVGVQLVNSLIGEDLHVLFAAEMQAARGTGLDAGRLQPGAHAVRAQSTLVDFFGGCIELGNVEGAAGNAVLAADAVGLVEVHNAVLVLHNRALCGAGGQASGIFAVHALVFAHQPTDGAVF